MNTAICIGFTLFALAAAGCSTFTCERVETERLPDTAESLPSVTVQDYRRLSLGRIFEPGKLELSPQGESALSGASDQIKSDSEVVVEVFPSAYHPHARRLSSINQRRAEVVKNRLAASGVHVVGTVVHPQPKSRDAAANARIDLVIASGTAVGVRSLAP